MTDHGYLSDGRAWGLVHHGGTWRVIAGWDYNDDTFRTIYQGTLERCREHIR